MIPPLTDAGVLPPGMHLATWTELCASFGGTPRRALLLGGLHRAATNLRDAGAVRLWLDGSFVTSKPEPNDFDGAWDDSTVDMSKVDPVLIDLNDLANGRLKQKAKYGGELLIGLEGQTGLAFQQYFQLTRDGGVKGIVLLNLRTLS